MSVCVVLLVGKLMQITQQNAIVFPNQKISMMAKFLIFWEDTGVSYFLMVAADKTEIVKSQNFACKCFCEAAICAVVKSSESDSNFKRFTGEDGRCCFTVVDDEDQLIIHSGMYESEQERDDAIDQIRRYADNAEIELYDPED